MSEKHEESGNQPGKEELTKQMLGKEFIAPEPSKPTVLTKQVDVDCSGCGHACASCCSYMSRKRPKCNATLGLKIICAILVFFTALAILAAPLTVFFRGVGPNKPGCKVDDDYYYERETYIDYCWMKVMEVASRFQWSDVTILCLNCFQLLLVSLTVLFTVFKKKTGLYWIGSLILVIGTFQMVMALILGGLVLGYGSYNEEPQRMIEEIKDQYWNLNSTVTGHELFTPRQVDHRCNDGWSQCLNIVIFAFSKRFQLLETIKWVTVLSVSLTQILLSFFLFCVSSCLPKNEFYSTSSSIPYIQQ